MLPDTGIDDVKKQRNAEYAKHVNDPVLSSLKMEGIRLFGCRLPLRWLSHRSGNRQPKTHVKPEAAIAVS
jgi:hypothetical protein